MSVFPSTNSECLLHVRTYAGSWKQTSEQDRPASFLLRPHIPVSSQEMWFHFFPLPQSLLRGNQISHTYFKTFSVSTFCSGFSFSASLSGTRDGCLILPELFSFFQPLQRSMWNEHEISLLAPAPAQAISLNYSRDNSPGSRKSLNADYCF